MICVNLSNLPLKVCSGEFCEISLPVQAVGLTGKVIDLTPSSDGLNLDRFFSGGKQVFKFIGLKRWTFSESNLRESLSNTVAHFGRVHNLILVRYL